jgi:hypothetical protein
MFPKAHHEPVALQSQFAVPSDRRTLIHHQRQILLQASFYPQLQDTISEPQAVYRTRLVSRDRCVERNAFYLVVGYAC